METVTAFVFLLFLGLAQAATYSSVQVAVAGIPELSLLNGNIALANGLTVTEKLKDPTFVGTVFAPTDAVLQPIKDQLGADLISMVPDNATFNYVLSTSVVPGKAYTLADLINLNGQTLTALTGNKVNVTVKQGIAGPIVYINQAPITGANIKAGNSIIHETGGIVVPDEYQQLVDGVSKPLVPASSVDLAQGGTAASTTPIPTVSDSTSSGSTQSGPAATAEAGSTTGTTTGTKNSSAAAAVGAALLAIPTLLAMLL